MVLVDIFIIYGRSIAIMTMMTLDDCFFDGGWLMSTEMRLLEIIDL